jgi:cytochrome c oxidase subunit 2
MRDATLGGGGSRPERGYNAPALRPAPFRTRRARVAIAASGALAAALAGAPSALAGVISPEHGGSPNADDINTLYLVAFGLGVLIFLLVEGVLIYSLVKFRWRRDGEPPAQIRGNTKLEIGWTIGAASILVVLTVVTFIFLGPIKNPAGSKPGGLVAELRDSGGGGQSGKLRFAALNQASPPGPANAHLNIKVNGQQFLWRYDYPGSQQVYSYTDMYVPINTTVTLDITASDVDHSWWIPKLGGKADAIPTYTNHTWFKVTKHGHENFRGFTNAIHFDGNCAELCGENHADMRARVIAVPVDQYQDWVKRQLADLEAARILLGKQREARNTRE